MILQDADRDFYDVVCFSHLRWDFVFQRPQHLMSRFARDRKVIYWEEPMLSGEAETPSLDARTCPETGVVAISSSRPVRRMAR